MPDTIREALTAAYAAAAKEPDSELDTETQAASVDAPADTSSGSDDNSEAATAPEDASDEQTAEEAPAATGASDKDAAPSASPPEPEINVPASWKAEARAEWAKVPPAARKMIREREEEHQRAMKASARARDRLTAIDSISQPYQPLLERYGVTLEQVMPPLLATRAALEIGTPEQKAELVANLIANFDIDHDLLGQAIIAHAGRPQVIQQPPPKVDYRQVPELSGLFQLADELKARQQQAAADQISEVSSAPHFEEVRLQMADILEMAKANGKTLTVKQAYNIACQMLGYDGLPADAAATSVSQAASLLAKSKAAASSVSGAPRPSPGRKPGEGSLRDEIEAQFAKRRS